MDLNMKIDLKNIDVQKIKAFLKRKETIIAIIVLIFIIAIIVIGNLLITDYRDTTSKRDIAKKSYESVIRADTNIESLNNKIEEANLETKRLMAMVDDISQWDLTKLLTKMQEDTGITWSDDKKKIVLNSKLKNTPELKVFDVKIDEFSGTFENLKGFLAYVEKMDRKVVVESLSFSRNKLTGKMSGSMKLTFYMRND